MNETIDIMLNHRSIREYQDRPVEEEKLDTIIQCFQQAPDWMNFQLCSAVVVRDAEKRKKLAELCGGQQYVAQAPVFIVFCGDFHRVDLACRKHGVDISDAVSHVDEVIVASHEAGIAAEAATVAAEAQGLGTVIIGSIRRNPQAVIELLGLPELVIPLLGLCVGYAAEDPGLKPRLPVQAARFDEVYNPNVSAYIDAYDETYIEYHRSRSSNQKADSWSDEVASYYSNPKERHTAVARMLEKQGFGHE